MLARLYLITRRAVLTVLSAELGVEDRAFLLLKTSQERFRDYDAPRGGGLFGGGRGFGNAFRGAPQMRMMAAAPAPPVAPVELGQGGEVE